MNILLLLLLLLLVMMVVGGATGSGQCIIRAAMCLVQTAAAGSNADGRRGCCTLRLVLVIQGWLMLRVLLLPLLLLVVVVMMVLLLPLLLLLLLLLHLGSIVLLCVRRRCHSGRRGEQCSNLPLQHLPIQNVAARRVPNPATSLTADARLGDVCQRSSAHAVGSRLVGKGNVICQQRHKGTAWRSRPVCHGRVQDAVVARQLGAAARQQHPFLADGAEVLHSNMG